ncbi:hypothetical protein Z517_05940 [Fonsecaea pedrosoi CBS 271.37]|uniref:Uncharacterized protein n=1 Tax=Fonsecaea pedrosoi CBS 271.37 TaxID=1442368 RepID=A0A0D2GEU8_9EURO|nr:uncharacterized protein Z517_05940 [Fonsecaea pedrosoi CBS 271.37]KIW79328.1 hypothetical protein Z517_05940 [Fonsecaea pedrosoi CBS 271.37]
MSHAEITEPVTLSQSQFVRVAAAVCQRQREAVLFSTARTGSMTIPDERMTNRQSLDVSGDHKAGLADYYGAFYADST